jgi:hypothetical protein
MMRLAAFMGWLLFGLTLFITDTAHASGTAPKCAAAKQKAAGKKANSLLACYAKATLKQSSVDSACVTKVQDKFTTAFAKADAAGGCILTGDAPNVEPVVDAFASNIVTLTPATMPAATPKCPAAKQKAAGKKASSLLVCYAKATLKQIAVDPACVTKAQDKFTAAFGKADTAGGCATTGDASNVEPVVDAFVTAMVGMTPVTTTSTSSTMTTTSTTESTTTTSTTSTTSTLPPACCEGYDATFGTGICTMADPTQCTTAGGAVQPGVCRNDGTCGPPTTPGGCCDGPISFNPNFATLPYAMLNAGKCFTVNPSGFTPLFCEIGTGTYSSSATCTATGCQ